MFVSFYAYAEFFPELPIVDKTLKYTKKWNEVTTDHFSVIFPQGMEEFAIEASFIFEDVHKKMSLAYGQENRHTNVILLPNIDDFNAFAVALIDTIFIILQQPLDNLSEEIKFTGTLRHTFIHEYAHILQGSIISGLPRWVHYLFPLYLPGTILPTWFIEGWATYEESQRSTTGRVHSSFTDMLLKQDALDGKLTRIEDLNPEYSKIPRGGYLVYLYSAKFLNFIAQKYGDKKLYELVHYFGKKLTPFFLDYKSKKIFGKSFHDLYKEWEDDIIKKYQKINTHTQGYDEIIFLSEKVDNMRVSPDEIVYFYDSIDSSIKKITKDNHKKRVFSLKKNTLFHLQQFEVDIPLLYLVINEERVDGFFSDLYRYDMVTKKLQKLTEKNRIERIQLLKDKNKILYVKNELTKRNIYELNLSNFTEVQLTNFGYHNQVLSISVSPDEKNCAFVYFDESTEMYNLYVMNLSNRSITQVTNDKEIETDLDWKNNNELLMSSNRDNVFNIFHYDFTTRVISKVSNESLGAFEPHIGKNNKLFYVAYGKKGYSLKSGNFKVESSPDQRIPIYDNFVDLEAKKTSHLNENIPKVESYHFFKRTIRPLGFLPYVSMGSRSNEASTLGLIALGFDPLFTNEWWITVGYMPQINDWELRLQYQLNYFYPNIVIGYERWPLLLNNRFFDENGKEIDTDITYEEKISAVNFGLKFPIHPLSSISFLYNYEDHNEVSERPDGAEEEFIPGSRRYAGFSSRYKLSNYNNSYSLTGYIYNRSFFSEYNQERIIVNYKRYHACADWYHFNFMKKQSITWVLQGGIAFGEIQQDVFYLGEQPVLLEISSSFTDVLIDFRGYNISEISGNRFLKTSFEYTIPLATHNYGIGYNLFIKKTTLDLFTDFGNAFQGSPEFSLFKWSIGPELNLDFNVMNSILATLVVGYAYRMTDGDQARFPYVRLFGRF